MQDHTPVLGKAPGPDARRDAIHVAIVPAVAAHPLRPGDHVGRLPDGTFWVTNEPIGIVDPFRTDLIEAGESFWLCLYPGSITSLRHVWSHPAFVPQVNGGGQ
jgi:hypothetical protein